MRSVLRVIDGLGYVAGMISAVFIVGIVGLILAEIFSRSVLNFGLSFSWEYSAYLMAAAFFCGAAFTLRSGGHVRVSLLSATIPRPVAKIVDGIATLIGMCTAIYLAYALCLFTWQSWTRGTASATVNVTPLWIPQLAITIGAVLLAAQLVARLVRVLMNEAPEDEVMQQTFGVE